MVYTVTFNPSLDYIISVDGFQLGKTNRTVKEQMLPGGKGINVSTVLKNLGIPNTALGFCAGFTGEEIEKRIGEMGLNSDFIHLESGYSRINVKMKDFDGTEINGQGPDIRSEETEKLLQKLEKLEATLWYWQAVFPRQCRSLFTGIYSDDWRDKEFWQW